VKLDQSSPAGGADRFQSTRWSVVLVSAKSQAPGSKEAFADLCELYWYPLYAFIRYRGHSPEDAQDLVQGFFLHLIEHKTLNRVDRSKGKFRSFLEVSVGALKTLIHRLRKRYTALIREEISRTVSDAGDVDAEIHQLCEALIAAEGWIMP
jgi:DNA-directed RNA polymerase specialized sigma24 family protein